MSETVLVAVIGAGATFLTAVVALVVSYRGFALIEARMLALENRTHQDISNVTGAVNELDKRLIRVEIKLGITE